MNELSTFTKIGIIIGKGNLPVKVLQACKDMGIEVFAIHLNTTNEAAPEYLADTPHVSLKLGQVGKAIKELKKAAVQAVVFAGAVARPSLSSIRPDALGLVLMAKLSKASMLGDNALLENIIDFFEAQGLRVIGSQDLVSSLFIEEGIHSAAEPTDEHYADIELGKKALKALDTIDVGQSVVTQQGMVVGIEAVEGTDQLIERCTNLIKAEGSRGVLIKMKKESQDNRIDLPTVGLETIQHIYDAGLAGMAIQAGSAIMLEQDAMIEFADQHDLFIIGIE